MMRSMTKVLVLWWLLLMTVATAVFADATMDDIRAWLDGAGLKYVVGNAGGRTCYVLPFKPSKSGLDSVDVAVLPTGDAGQCLVVYAKVIDLPPGLDASVYRKILEWNAGFPYARFAITDGVLQFVHSCPMRLLDRDHLLLMIYDVAQFVDNTYREIEKIVKSAPSVGMPSAGSEASADLVSKTKSGVVQITAERSDGHQRGSGFVVSDRFVIASRHVVEEAEKVWAVVNGRSIALEIVNGPTTDVDVVLLRASEPLPGCKPLAVATNVEAGNRVGEDVWVVGFPGGDPNLTVTRGLLAGFSSRSGVRCLKTTATVAKGNSGGPVLNGRGEVIGVVQGEAEGFSYAVMADELQNLIAYAGGRTSQPLQEARPLPRQGAELQA